MGDTMSTTPSSPPAANPLGYIPGLGHLLRGDWPNAIGLTGQLLILIWAAVAGFPRLGALLFPEQGGSGLHPWIALVSWFGVLGLVGYTTWAGQQPPPPKDAVRSPTAELIKQFQRNRAGVFGLHIVSWMIVLALLTPLVAPFDPDAIAAGDRYMPPQPGYWMGTDDYGRDLLSRSLYGARISLSIGFIAVGLSATLGALIGAVAGYFGGWVDRASMWLVDLLLALPRLVLLLTIVGLFRSAGAQSLFLIVVILGLTGWMGVSRIVRAQVLTLKEQDFVQACRAMGIPDSRIILGHILPNAMAPVIVNASLAIGGTILTEASLSFLGLGVPPPTATWGSIINDGREFMRTAPWITIGPGLLIVLAVMSFNLLGDGLRDALDPKLRGRA